MYFFKKKKKNPHIQLIINVLHLFYPTYCPTLLCLPEEIMENNGSGFRPNIP